MESGLPLKYIWFHLNRKRPVQCSTSFSLCHISRSKRAKSEALYFPLTSCLQFVKQYSQSHVFLKSYPSLPRNANLLHCPACPSGLPLPISPIFVTGNLSASASHQQQPVHSSTQGSSCLASDVQCCFPLSTRPEHVQLIYKIHPVANFGSKFNLTF